MEIHRTMPQFMRRRFGESTHRFIAYYALFTTLVMWLGESLYAGGLVLSQIMGWPLWVSVVLLTLIATSFTVAGGLAAVVITDSFQAILMILGAGALTIIGFTHVGGFEALGRRVPEDYWRLLLPADCPRSHY